ncbi:MAG: glycosyltransferase, partial [Candidatus Omnitrophica bacterium]|nr:glycosyltransferase [Candidatus Omnitrophota bacterium]
MNILFLTTHLNSGGITSYLFTLSKGLIQRGNTVHIVSSGGNMEQEFVAMGAKSVILNIKTKSELDPKIYIALPRLKKYIRQNHIDIIHAQTRVTQVMANFLKQLTHVPYVTTCHGFFKPRLFRRIFPCWGDMAIAISPSVMEHLHNDFRRNPLEIALVRSGIDACWFSAIDENLRKQKRLSLG